MGIVFGLAAAFFWGTGDFLITHLTRRIGTQRALMSIQLLSLLAWLLLLLVSRNRPGGNAALWGILLATALCHVLGLVFVYRAFEIGTLSIVSPISSGFAIVTALLALATGERPPALAILGAMFLIIGVVLATRPSGPRGQGLNLKGVPEAILSALAFGTMFWLFYFHVEPRLGHVWPLVLLKTMACGSTLMILLWRRQRGAIDQFHLDGRGILLAVGAALADTLAWLTYILGSQTSYATVVTALASLFSVFTVLLAWRFLRERLSPHQWTGVAIILCGILLVSI